MKLVRLQGGLGNQIFQYALCKFLELSGHRAMLDGRHLGRYSPPREFALDEVFSDVAPYLWRGESWNDASLLTRMLATHVLSSRMLSAVGGRDIVVEPASWSLATDIAAGGKYYVGYWQSDSLVEAVEPHLKRSLIAVSQQDIRNLGIPNVGMNDVAFHVRRGDYVTSARASNHHGTLVEDYYRRAAERCRQLGCTRAIVFSDDIEWCRHHMKNLPLELFFVDPMHGCRDVIEFKMMLEYRNHVIANSTFSWWGARLAKGKADGFTIAPLRWFVNGSAGFLPASWEVL